MSNLRTIYCNSILDLPSLSEVEQELSKHDSIRIDYSLHSKFASSKEFREYLNSLRSKLNVEIKKGQLNDLEFYNIYNLFLQPDVHLISQSVENAAKEYRLDCERLIMLFEDKYDFSFSESNESVYSLRQKFDSDNHKLSKKWSYSFHGGDVCFSNSKTGQIVDINLKYKGYYGVLDLWFFQYYMKTTKSFKLLSGHFEDNTPKLIQLLNFLEDKNKLILVNGSKLFPAKYIWNKNVVNNSQQG